jgi:hypothetical protein
VSPPAGVPAAASPAAFDASTLSAVRVVGTALPPDVIAAVVTGRDLPGLTADSYHLELGLSPREAANRAWTTLSGAWVGFRDALAKSGPPATGLTREKWLSVVLRELGFGRVPPTPAGGLVADGRSWPVSHLADNCVPIHLLGWEVALDAKTPGMAGAAERAPHSMVQELLNRADEYLWAVLSNGAKLRLLRDSSTLIGASYVEFDLAAIFDGDLFSDFVVLYLVCHQSRFEPTDAELGPASCWLEQWRTHASDVGTRALGALRVGVHDAIEVLASGLLAHPANSRLRTQLDTKQITPADLQRAVTRLVYRLLFCFVAEDRGLLLDPHAAPAARDRYTRWFSTARLRRVARRRRGDGHSDQWQALNLVLAALGHEEGCPELGLVGLGGLFEAGPADHILDGLAITNRNLLAAIRDLSLTRPVPGGPLRVVDYRHLGAEELGGVYENLLEYVPTADTVARRFQLKSVVGNERKKSGAYYTPVSLTETLLDSALDPLLDRAEGQVDPVGALLELKVCDPACGSGHFLVVAARRIAARVAAIRAEGSEPSETLMNEAMADVVARCIYGVDINPLAAELAKVSLWLEAVQPGRALGLLDGHIKVGNALLGTTPALLAAGIPDAAYTAIEGDDKKTAAALKRQNRADQAGQLRLDASTTITIGNTHLAAAAVEVENMAVRDLADLHVAEKRLREIEDSPEAVRARLVADAWCAAFVAQKRPGSPELTQAKLEAIAAGRADPALVETVEALARQYRFFHWHLEFPHIFHTGSEKGADPVTGWSSGFDVVIGNPPWERVKLQEQEWFAARMPAIAEAPNAAARKRLIALLEANHPEIHAAFLADRRQAEGESHLIRNSGRFPLAGRGDVNTYAVFAETDRSILSGTGRLGVILPTGIATDATTQHFFKDLVTTGSVASLYDFENRDRLFEAVDSRVKFCLLTLTGRNSPSDVARFAFFAHHPGDLARDGATFILTPEEITLLNPNTRTCPIFRSRRDAEITLGIYRRHPVLIRKNDPDGNPWGVSFMRMIDMANDSNLFRAREQLEGEGWTLDGNVFRRGAEAMLPLYEAKMIHHYDHRWATYEPTGEVRDVTEAEHADADFVVMPRYWVASSEVDTRLASRQTNGQLLGFRDICRSTDERTMIAATFPVSGVGNKLPLLFTTSPHRSCLVANLSSFVADFVARQKLGGTTMNYFYFEQFAIAPPVIYDSRRLWTGEQSLASWIDRRTEELTDCAFGMATPPDFRPYTWKPIRRAILRAELDAAFFHIYGIGRDDVEYILSTFPIAMRKDPELTGRILAVYDALSMAIEIGEPFVSTLDPPPGYGPRHPVRS